MQTPDSERGSRPLVNTRRLGAAVVSCAAAGAVVGVTAAGAWTDTYCPGLLKHGDSGCIGPRMSTFSYFKSQAEKNRGVNDHGGKIWIQAHYITGQHAGTYGHAWSEPNGETATSHFNYSPSITVQGKCWNGTNGFSAITCTEIGSGPA